jgi:hypothetical protein
MARRGHIGDGRQGFQINPIDFLRGGGGDNKDDTAMAMALMGYGKGTSPQDQALEAQKQTWAEKYQAGQLSLEELRQKAAEANYKSEAEARTAAAANAAQQRIDEAAKQANLEKYQAGQLDYLTKKADRDAAVEVFKNAVEHGGLKEGTPQYNLLAEAAMPGITEKRAVADKAIFEQNVAAGLEKYQKATPKEREVYAKTPGSFGPQDIYGEVLKRVGVNVATPTTTVPTAKPFEGAISKPWQEYQAPPDLSELLKPAPAPSGTEGIAPWLRPEVPSTGAMDWRYGGGGPSVDPGRYEKFPGSVEDLIAAGRQQPVPESVPVPVPVQAPSTTPGFLDELLHKIRGGGPPMPSQGVFQPFPG